MQSFCEGAVMREVNEIEARQQHRKDEQNDERTRFVMPNGATGPSGLGLAERLHAVPQVPQAGEDERPHAPVVNVNVGGTAGGVGVSNDIDRLANFVLGARDFERTQRLRTAVGILHATASSDEERRVLGARLDEAIAARSKTAAAQDEGGPFKLARVAFDKLKDLL